MPRSPPKHRPGKVQARQHQPTPSIPLERYGQGRGGRPWRRLRDKVLARDGYACQLCGTVTIHLDCDHIVPLSKGGTDDMSNLRALCRPCHRRRGD